MPKMKPGERLCGRAKGTPNKSTASVKAALTQAFENLGGVEYLEQWAEAEPTEFMKLWAKMLPQDVVIDAAPGLAEALVRARKRIEGST